MAFAVGQGAENPAIDPNVSFHILGNLQRAANAAAEREEDATDEVIAVLREALLRSQEANQTLQERHVLEAERVNVLENRITGITAQCLEETRALQDQVTALQEQVNALQARANADATEIANLKKIEEWQKSLRNYLSINNYDVFLKRVSPPVYNKIFS